MRKTLLTLLIISFTFSSCFVVRSYREKRERYYELNPGKALIKGKNKCNIYPKPLFKGRY